MIANIQACGESKTQVNTSKRPIFKFGNGMRTKCMATINRSVGAGEKFMSMIRHPACSDLSKGSGSSWCRGRLQREQGHLQGRESQCDLDAEAS